MATANADTKAPERTPLHVIADALESIVTSIAELEIRLRSEFATRFEKIERDIEELREKGKP